MKGNKTRSAGSHHSPRFAFCKYFDLDIEKEKHLCYNISRCKKNNVFGPLAQPGARVGSLRTPKQFTISYN